MFGLDVPSHHLLSIRDSSTYGSEVFDVVTRPISLFRIFRSIFESIDRSLDLWLEASLLLDSCAKILIQTPKRKVHCGNKLPSIGTSYSASLLTFVFPQLPPTTRFAFDCCPMAVIDMPTSIQSIYSEMYLCHSTTRTRSSFWQTVLNSTSLVRLFNFLLLLGLKHSKILLPPNPYKAHSTTAAASSIKSTPLSP